MLEKLKQLGWSEYEARAYTALLSAAPATGYRVAKESGVPAAKIYEALARLGERGAVRGLPTGDGGHMQYVAVPPEELLAGIRARHTQMLAELERDLAELGRGETSAEAMQRLNGLTPILGRASTLLGHARTSVSVAAAPSWEPGLRRALDDCARRGVRIERVTLPAFAGTRRGETLPESGLLVLVVDGSEALIAQRDAVEKESTAFVTTTPFLAAFCADYVRLRRAVALMPEAVAHLQRQDDWLDWEESKQRRLLQIPRSAPPRGTERPTVSRTPQ